MSIGALGGGLWIGAQPAQASGLCADAPIDVPALDLIMRAGPVGAWQAGDGAAPVPLDDGSTLFLFGDSIIDDRWVHSSALHVDGACIDDVYRGEATGAPQSIWTPLVPGSFYWPSDGYSTPDGWLWVALSEVEANGEGGLFGFDGVDVDYAQLDLSFVDGAPMARPTIVDHGPWDSTPLGRLAVVHVDSDPAIVNFRVLDCGEGGYCGSYLAKLTDLSNPAAPWLWWDGETWQGDPLAVVDIAPGLDFFDSRVIGPVEHDGRWYGATWAMGYGASVAILSAPEVTGPWTIDERRPVDGVQYLAGVFVLGDELALRWSNNDPALADLERMRPGFAVLD